jgi:hypothetical protein
MHPTPDDTRPWYRHRSPWLLMLGPAVIVVAGLSTAWLAIDTDDGLVVGEYYKEGKAINRVLRREQMAESLGLSASVRFEAAGHLLRVSLRQAAADTTPDHGGAAARTTLPESLEVLFSHPTRAGEDRNVSLRREQGGDYVGVSTPPGEGRWHVTVQDAAGAWRLTGRWAAQPDSPPLQLVAGAVGPARVPIGLPPGVPPPTR